jgi:hypothetical protein
VGEQLSAMNGITEVFSVGGRYDLVAILRVVDNDALAALVTEQMLKVDGITDSETLIAFRVFFPPRFGEYVFYRAGRVITCRMMAQTIACAVSLAIA